MPTEANHNAPDVSRLIGEREMFRKQFLKVQENYENKISELSILKELANTLRFTNFYDREAFFWRQLNIINKYACLKNITLMLLDETGDILDVVAESNTTTPTYAPQRITLAESPARQAVAEAGPVLSDTAERAETGNTGSRLFVPLIHNQRAIGVLDLVHGVGKGFNQNQIRFFSLVADQIATQVVLFRIYHQMLKEEKQRLSLSRFFSKTVTEKIFGAGENLQLGGERKKVTILFADLQGFTAMSEELDQEEVVNILNAYFSIATPIVFRHDGTLDKLMGDGIMAFFGAPISHEDDGLRAVETAVELTRALRAFNTAKRHEHWPDLDVSIGINTGEVVAGYIGSQEHLNYTVIGDAVNTAQRLQSIAGTNTILISKAVYEEIRDRLPSDNQTLFIKPMAAQKLKGKETATDIFKVEVRSETCKGG